MLRYLTQLGHPLTTSVVINGRSLSVSAAIKLIEELPEDTQLGRRGPQIYIHPDPFALPLTETGRVRRRFDSAELVQRFVDRQNQTDLLEEQQLRQRLWQRLLRLLRLRS
jgi:hypothetical protein